MISRLIEQRKHQTMGGKIGECKMFRKKKNLNEMSKLQRTKYMKAFV